MAGKRIIDLPACMSLGLTDLMEISQYSSTQVSGKVTLAQLTAYFNATAAGLPNVLALNNNTGGLPILITSGDNLQAATNSFNNLALEPTYTSLSASDPTSSDQFFGQYISGYTQLKSTDLASGNYTNINIAQEIGTLKSLNAGLGYYTQLEWSPEIWKINSSLASFAGLQYNADYSANYTNRSLIDKGYAAATFAPLKTDATETISVTGTSLVLSNTPTFIYGVYLNGQRLTLTTDYTIATATITFLSTLTSDSVTVVYKY